MILENLLNENQSATSKPEMENVELEKEEYKLIGKYLRTKGLKLYAYNSLNNTLEQLDIECSDTLHLKRDEYGRLKAVDVELERVTINSKDIHFEALNMKNAKKRLKKFKEGKIKYLCNLREPGEGISFW
jgi:hypothetical protein